MPSDAQPSPALPDDLAAELSAFAEELAEAARTETLPRFRAGGDVLNKEDAGFDPVTAADREAEAAIRKLIETRYPDPGILGEEYGEKPARSAFRWVLDPVDGTRAFICGVPSWTTLIALEVDGAPTIGLVDQPFSDERWLGGPGGAVHISAGRRRRIRANARARLADARLHTTEPRSKPLGYFLEGEAETFARVSGATRVTRLGLDAYGYALVASDGFDLVLEAGVQRYDVAAPIALIRAAGGVVTDWRGGDPLGGDRIEMLAAANGDLHAEVLDLLAG